MHGVSSADKLTRVKNGIKLNRASRVSIIEFGLIKSAREERTSNKLLADRSYSPSEQVRETVYRGKITLKISDDLTGNNHRSVDRFQIGLSLIPARFLH